MLCLYYHDECERAQAVISVAHCCRQLDGRLALVGPDAVCEATREAVRRLEPALLPCLTIRPVDLPANTVGVDHVWAGAVEPIRAALLDTFAMGGSVASWVEPPLPRDDAAMAKALQDYCQAVLPSAPAAGVTVISAFPVADVSERALRALMAGSFSLISAKMILPHCPAWLIRRTPADVMPPAESPRAIAPVDLLVAPMLEADKLAPLGQLAAGIAHELGNPLSIISSSLQYLHQRLAAANDPASDFTMTALQNVERMQERLRSMLDSAVMRKPHLERVDLRQIVSHVLRFMSEECARRSIAIDISFATSLGEVWADPSGITAILLNLVKNALEALAHDGNRLCVRTRMGKRQTAVVEIENNGPAIPADVLRNLFRPFWTTKQAGTGLGLYLSRQIARDHGGELVAENLPNAVRFTLTLPVGSERSRSCHTS